VIKRESLPAVLFDLGPLPVHKIISDVGFFLAKKKKKEVRTEEVAKRRHSLALEMA
jgi:hypothetical protein